MHSGYTVYFPSGTIPAGRLIVTSDQLRDGLFPRHTYNQHIPIYTQHARLHIYTHIHLNSYTHLTRIHNVYTSLETYAHTHNMYALFYTNAHIHNIYTVTHLYTYAHLYTYTCLTPLSILTRIHTHIYTLYAHVHIYTPLCTFIRIYTCVHTCTRPQTSTHN